MKPDPVEFSRAEGRVVACAAVVVPVAELGFRVLDNTTGIWWPSIAWIGCLTAFALGFATHIARSRSRSIRSVLALAIPDRFRRKSS